MSEFGIYFGPEVINITEVKGEKASINISIPQSGIIGSATEQKVLDESKIATALKGEFIKYAVSPSSVSVALAGEDLIIRTFDMPVFISRRELEYNAITYEAKKYIPFKIDDLAFNFRLYHDWKDKKNLILFVGIKKEILNKYISIFKQLQIQVRLIEYAGFGILRLLRSGGIKDTGTLGLLNVDSEDEINFLVSQNGFPLFSRDISLAPGLETEAKSDFMDKLTSEIRISLDFFRRKFPSKPLDKIVILSSPQFQTEIAALIKDLGLSTISLETSAFLGKNLEFSAALAKSYATAISNIRRLRYPINLLKPAIKKVEAKELSIQALPAAITAIRISPKIVLLAFLIIFLTIGWGWYRRLPLENKLKAMGANQPIIPGISGEQSARELTELESEYTNKVNIMDGVIKNRFYLTETIDIIPRVLPRGAWLTSLTFHTGRDKLELNLEGMVFLANSDKEFAAVDGIVLGLNNDPKFSQRFKEINIVSMQRLELTRLKLEATSFKISCH